MITGSDYWKKVSIHGEVVTSQPHWFSGSQLDISKFSIFNNFFVYSPICMKFASKQFGFRNSVILDMILLFLILFL